MSVHVNAVLHIHLCAPGDNPVRKSVRQFKKTDRARQSAKEFLKEHPEHALFSAGQTPTNDELFRSIEDAFSLPPIEKRSLRAKRITQILEGV